jgi:outer membrane protein assembly factor BamB
MYKTENVKPRRKLPLWGCLGTLLIIAVIGGVAWGIWSYIESITPFIASIPALTPGQTQAVLLGRSFGAQPGSVWLMSEGQSRQAAEIVAWQDDRITVHLPDGVSRGSLAVQQQTTLGDRFSDAHDFITSRPPSSGNSTLQAPTQPGSPWPTFRRDMQNTGRSPIVGQYNNDKPWLFTTGKGIFSTPIIDAQGRIYFGSADHFFYALNPDGSLNWKYETGEIIDSAGALFDAAAGSQEAPLVFISGDGNMYGFKLDDNIPNAADRMLWKYTAELRPQVSFNRWFEGNVAVGPDGSLYSGNTNFLYYALDPNGKLKWTYPTDSNNWSMAAFGPDGTIYWASLDTFIRAVSPSGKELWRTRTLGFVAASAAVGSDGTVYIGSFDSNLYALDPATGKVRWKYPTSDHIYTSAALGQDSQGNTNAIYFGSADGSLYAVKPDGSLLWRYDTGDPIRSSPAIGLVPGTAPDGTATSVEVVYFGCGNGKLYALNAADGSLRWAYDTTPNDPELQDRNDLNGSPALGQNGIYIGGEHGNLVYVPYDYCLHASDPLCSTTNSDLPGRLSQAGVPSQAGLFYVTPGGNTLADFPATLSPGSMVTLRLVVIKNGQTWPAFVCNYPFGCPASDLQVQFDPPLSFKLDHSADGRYIYIRPDDFLKPDTDYQLSVSGRYYSGGLRLGNMTLFGTPRDAFKGHFQFHTAASTAAQPPLQVTDTENSALEWTRLAAPLPPMLPSLNQIGFDYMDWIMGTIAITPPDAQNRGKVILWAVGAKRNADGQLVVDPKSSFTLPLSGSYQNDTLMLANQSFKMPITGINIPFNRFELRGQLGSDGIMHSPSVFADANVLSIPKFGPYLVIAGLANNIYQKLLVAGTYITRPYPADDLANHAPSGIAVDQVLFTAPQKSQDGRVTVTFKLAKDASYSFNDHRPAILLVDPDKNEAVFMDYAANLSAQADASGNLASVSLRVPAGMTLPAGIQAYVIMDVFPIAKEPLVK